MRRRARRRVRVVKATSVDDTLDDLDRMSSVLGKLAKMFRSLDLRGYREPEIRRAGKEISKGLSGIGDGIDTIAGLLEHYQESDW